MPCIVSNNVFIVLITNASAAASNFFINLSRLKTLVFVQYIKFQVFNRLLKNEPLQNYLNQGSTISMH